MLFVPLYLIQRGMERRVGERQVRTERAVGELTKDVRTTQAEVRRNLDDLRTEVRTRMTERVEDDREAFAKVGIEPSFPAVRDALRTATELNLISRNGVRVRITDPSLAIFARLQVVGESLLVRLEERYGEELARLSWDQNRPPDDFMVQVGQALRAATVYPGDDFDPALLFSELAELLQYAERYSDKYKQNGYTGLIQLFKPQWMLFDWGIAAYGDTLPPYTIDIRQIRKNDRWYRHMEEKAWTDIDSFEQAHTTALMMAESGTLAKVAALAGPE